MWFQNRTSALLHFYFQWKWKEKFCEQKLQNSTHYGFAFHFGCPKTQTSDPKNSDPLGVSKTQALSFSRQILTVHSVKAWKSDVNNSELSPVQWWLLNFLLLLLTISLWRSWGNWYYRTRFVRSCSCQSLTRNKSFVLDSVVLKKLLQESVDDQNEFLKEARMLYNLQYENVVSFKAFCQRPSTHWNMLNLFYL